MKLQTLLLAAALAAAPSALLAQEVSVHLFTASMSPSNENPALEKDAFGDALISIKAYRDANGALTQAVVDFNIHPISASRRCSRACTSTAAPRASTVRWSSTPGFEGRSKRTPERACCSIRRPLTDPDRLASVEEILASPAAFYVNLHATSAPPGFIRGQLQRTTLSMIQMTKAQTASIEAKVDALKATVDRIAGRLGIIPVTAQ